MNTEQLKEYLGIVADMEQSIYLQERMIYEVRNEHDHLGLEAELSKPRKPAEFCQEKPITATVAVVLCILVIVAGGCLIGYSIDRFGGPNTVRQLLGALLLLPLGAIIAIAGMIGFGYALKNNNKKWAEYNRKKSEFSMAERAYQRELSAYEQEIRGDQQRVKLELAQKRGLTADLQKMQAKYIESKQKLNEIYSHDIVFPKYRNLAMICSIYEYLCSGRCTSLEGHEGAYNILEMEIRMDRIITRLDDVISELEKIQQNQFMLYSAIKESNQKASMILESTFRMADQLKAMQEQSSLQSAAINNQIAELQKSSELTAYHAERAQKELHYMNRMNYLTGKNNGPFSNLPPV